MGGVVIKNNEKGVIEKLRNQLEFYLGDSNLAKDRFLQKKLETTLSNLWRLIYFR